MSLLEAMALGRPVIATDVGGTAELVRHGETGYLLPPGDGQRGHARTGRAGRGPGPSGRDGRRRPPAPARALHGRADGGRLPRRIRGGDRSVARPDVLLVSLGTTLGWRVADRMLVEQLERAGRRPRRSRSAAAPRTGSGAATP